jgi:hypothetical protein
MLHAVFNLYFSSICCHRFHVDAEFLSQSAHCANIKCAVCCRSIVYPTQVVLSSFFILFLLLVRRLLYFPHEVGTITPSQVREAPPLVRYTCPACHS